jgi:acetyl esterase/lipase
VSELIEPVGVPQADFPHSTVSAPGMITLQADLRPRYGTALLGIQYAEKDGCRLHLQVLLPPMAPESNSRYPAVLYVQGSAWFPQNLGQELPGLADFARRGYVVAIVEYRPSALAPFPAQVDDTKSAVRFLRANAGRFHVDPDRIALWGDSSGGHTTVHVHLDPEPLGLRCAVDFYGPTDISRMNTEPSIMDHRGPDSPEGMLIGGRPVLENPELVAPTIAMNRIPTDRRLPPLLIMHGSQDRLVPFGQSVLLYEALVAAGQPVALYQLRGSDHGGPAFWQPAVLDIVDDFLRKHLR